MPNCLGIYTQNNIIKYAKMNTNKSGSSLRLATYGVRFSENVRETIEEIIRETDSANDEIATNITSEKYELIDVFSRLNKKDTKELITTEFSNICTTKGLVPSVLDMKFRLAKNTGDADRYRAICISTGKSEITNIFQNFGDHKISSIAPLGTSITNILPSKGIEEQAAIINIEDETVVTILENGEIAEIESFPIGMRDVLPKLAEKYNSYSKAYEACKGVSAYIEDVYALEDADREVLDLLIPMLYDLRARVEKMLKPHMPVITKIYLTGTGLIINNLDLYFHEVFTDKSCQLLVPYFLPRDSNNLNDILEVDTAIALAFNGIGYSDKDVEYISGSAASLMKNDIMLKKLEDVKEKGIEFFASNPLLSKVVKGKAPEKKKKINIEFNDEVVENETKPEVKLGNEFDDTDKITFFDATEGWLARTAGTVLVAFLLYSGVAYYTQKVIDDKNVEVNANKLQVNGWISEAKSDITSIDKETNKYRDMKNSLQELLNKVTTRTVSFDIPNFMSKLMFVIPENVKVTSIVVEGGRIEMNAESGQYAQLGYFVSRLKLDKVLTDVDMSVISMSGNIKIKVSGAMP